jgi:hypothetical protein
MAAITHIALVHHKKLMPLDCESLSMQFFCADSYELDSTDTQTHPTNAARD